MVDFKCIFTDVFLEALSCACLLTVKQDLLQ